MCIPFGAIHSSELPEDFQHAPWDQNLELGSHASLTPSQGWVSHLDALVCAGPSAQVPHEDLAPYPHSFIKCPLLLEAFHSLPELGAHCLLASSPLNFSISLRQSLATQQSSVPTHLLMSVS